MHPIVYAPGWRVRSRLVNDRQSGRGFERNAVAERFETGLKPDRESRLEAGCSSVGNKAPSERAVVHSLKKEFGVWTMCAKSQHVVPRGKNSAVRKAGADKVTRLFDTQREAVNTAQRLARKQGGDVIIFGRDGRIRDSVLIQEDDNGLYIGI